MIQPEMRSELPVLPGREDDVFTKMGLLFVQAYEEIIRMRSILEVSKEANDESEKIDTEKLMTKYMQIINNYIEARHDDVENMPMKFLEIVREYQELLFAEPMQEEDE
jgi:hypothetical protein